MGGFLLVRQTGNCRPNPPEQQYGASLKALKKKGLELTKTVDRPNFRLFCYGKIQFSCTDFIDINGDDFIYCHGTLIYKGYCGENALRDLHRDFSPSGEVFTDARGQFSVVLYRSSQLYVFNDYIGLMPIYTDLSGKVMSSSLLSVRKSLPSVSVSRNELYEYVLTGATYADATFFREIRRLDGFYIHQFSPEHTRHRKRATIASFGSTTDFNHTVEDVCERMTTYFRDLADFQPRQAISALTGGFDSRMILAACRKIDLQLTPFVYGEHSSQDVQIARQIADGESLHLHNLGTVEKVPIAPDAFIENSAAHFNFLDGLGYEGSLNDQAPDYTRLQSRAGVYGLRLHGGAGEVFRNFWKLVNARVTVRDYAVKSLAINCVNDAEAMTGEFSLSDFVDQYSEKVKQMLDAQDGILDQQQVALSYPLIRSKYWAGPTISADNLYCHALMPFADPVFSLAAARIPLKFKQNFALASAVIRKLDEAVSSYPSTYGFNLGDRPSVLQQLKYQLHCLVKSHATNGILLTLHRKASRRKESPGQLYYLRKAYTECLLDTSQMEISRYVNLGMLRSEAALNRALTVELHLQDVF